MMTPLATLTYRILPLTCLTGLLAACTPPPTVAPSANLNLDLRRLQVSFDRQEQALAELSGQVAELENRLQRHGEELETLRQAGTGTRIGGQGLSAGSAADRLAPALQAEGSATEVYLQAFGDYASGRYQAAIAGFETFLVRFPNNSYASNAQFWLGDCYFNQQQYALAIDAFEQLLADYPNASKSPDALLKMAIAHLQLGAPEQARQAVDTLGRRYPDSTATQKARELTIP